MRFTHKQRQIMGLVAYGYFDEHSRTPKWYDIDQVIDMVPYKVGKRPMQASVDILERRGLIRTEYQVRRKKRRRVLVPTEFALSIFRPKATVSEPNEDVEIAPGQSPESLFSEEGYFPLDSLG